MSAVRLYAPVLVVLALAAGEPLRPPGPADVLAAVVLLAVAVCVHVREVRKERGCARPRR